MVSDSVIPVAFIGFATGGALILAIGAQNAFVLRQGLLRSHVFVICLTCAASDALLIAAGVGGFGTLVSQSPLLISIATYGGAAFLLVYAALSLRRAWSPDAMQAASNQAQPLWPALATALAFTWANPHVYLDTVVLLGSISATYEGVDRVAFGFGAVTASFVWFFSLGYGARLLEPIFARPRAWQVLDVLIAVVMTAIAIKLLS